MGHGPDARLTDRFGCRASFSREWPAGWIPSYASVTSSSPISSSTSVCSPMSAAPYPADTSLHQTDRAARMQLIRGHRSGQPPRRVHAGAAVHRRGRWWRQPRIYTAILTVTNTFTRRTRNRLHHELGEYGRRNEGGAVAICAPFDIPWLVIRALRSRRADSGWTNRLSARWRSSAKSRRCWPVGDYPPGAFTASGGFGE